MRAHRKVELICSTLHAIAYATLAIERQSMGYWILTAAVVTGLGFAIARANETCAR